MTPRTPSESPQEPRRLSARLVYVTQTGTMYHLKPHTPSWVVTWTQRFAERGLGLLPCQTCFRGRRPRHRGHLIEEGNELRWEAVS